MTLKVTKADYHRNGVGGEGFHVCLFDYQQPGKRKARKMLGVLFAGAERCAVFDRDLLAAGVVGMHEGPGNAWRGDDFEPELRRQVTARMDTKWAELEGAALAHFGDAEHMHARRQKRAP